MPLVHIHIAAVAVEVRQVIDLHANPQMVRAIYADIVGQFRKTARAAP